ncbi:glycoside hydrolase, family 14, partial [Kipferlia bialata]
HPEWTSPPTDAGGYNTNPPSSVDFFQSGYKSEYGVAFLTWYSQRLIDHGSKILAKAEAVFGDRVDLAMKIAGIHWWYGDATHAAELTAGYYNLYGQSGYAPIARMFGQYNARFDFTCLEMTDAQQAGSNAACMPVELVHQTMDDAAGLTPYCGENALARYDWSAYATIEEAIQYRLYNFKAFTYLRMDDTFMQSSNLQTFEAFVGDVHSQPYSWHHTDTICLSPLFKRNDMPYITPWKPAYDAFTAHVKTLEGVPLLSNYPSIERVIKALLTFHRTLVNSTPEADTPYGNNVCIGMPCMPQGLPKDLLKALPKDLGKSLHKTPLVHPESNKPYAAYLTVFLLAAEDLDRASELLAFHMQQALFMNVPVAIVREGVQEGLDLSSLGFVPHGSLLVKWPEAVDAVGPSQETLDALLSETPFAPSTDRTGHIHRVFLPDHGVYLSAALNFIALNFEDDGVFNLCFPEQTERYPPLPTPS